MIGRILIVEDEMIWRERMAEALSDEGHKVYLATSLEEAREHLYGVKPDVLILDMVLRLYRWQGSTLLEELEVMPNSPEVIIVSDKINRKGKGSLWRGYDIFDVILKENYDNGHYFIQTVRDALEAKRHADESHDEPLTASNADALLSLTEVEKAVLREVARGKTDEPSTVSDADTPCPLTEAEKAVLREVARGKPNKEIAVNRSVVHHTIKTQLGSIYRKLGVVNRIEAIRAARKLGCIPGDDDELM